MNCPSRNDDTLDKHPSWNQSPNPLNNDSTSRQDLNGITNLRSSRNHLPRDHMDAAGTLGLDLSKDIIETRSSQESNCDQTKQRSASVCRSSSARSASAAAVHKRWLPPSWHNRKFSSWRTIKEFASFLGPGFLVAVAYIDPGNYATDVAAGAESKYQLLFVVLMSNVFAVVLQSLSIRLGTVTGKNLAEHCRDHLPKWLNICLYILAEVAIIATDLAEVIGSTIALNLLFNIPLVAGCAITLVDVLLILLFYNPKGSLSRLRLFELFVGGLVIAVVVCFCIQLSLIRGSTAGEVLYGYLPSSAVVNGQGIYLSCGILGATVMPHSIYLGSGLCQPRLQYYDMAKETSDGDVSTAEASDEETIYVPSLSAIKHCLRYSTAELIVSLTGFALFVNSAILIVAGSSLSSVANAGNADLFGIYDLLSSTISRGAAIIFTVALFFSGTAAGIVCTIAGQMVSEGHLHWTIAPWMRRLLTRSISITPSMIIAAAVGREGLSTALTASQVALSIILPFVTAPLIYFTARNKYMTVAAPNSANTTLSDLSPAGQELSDSGRQALGSPMRNHRLVTLLASAIWLVILIMNVALLVFLGLGQS